MNIKDLISKAISALEKEIEAVREKPSSDVLFNGTKQKVSHGTDGETDYKFETNNQSIKFAEEIRALVGDKEMTVHPIAFENSELILRFPKNQGDLISEVHLEWENDFILKRTLNELFRIDENESLHRRIEHLFIPQAAGTQIETDTEHDGQRNAAQLSAIRKAMQNRALFIWGPPGTGKTATLGYIIANYLKQGKTVLFASNTNRAVDVGLLSALEAIEQTGITPPKTKITRFGEAALDNPELEPYLFDTQLENRMQEQKAEAGEWASLLTRREVLFHEVEDRLRNGKQPTKKQEEELKLIDQKVADIGGRDKLEEMIEELTAVSDRSELRKKQLVATTLAKVCTSELFFNLDFDAVVVDEGSMANLPYLIVLATHCKWHMVVVGDPMQLPPISITPDHEAREFLEKDIFTTVSGASTTGELFRWHDENPGFTAFFDTQYRLEESLADVISTVFYEGRLKTEKPAESSGYESSGENGKSVHLVDSSKYRPSLEQKTSERGFKPVNLVHQEVVERLIQKLQMRGIRPEEIGVIVPFRSAVYDLRNRLYENGIRGVEVGTIHTFQGREKDYIIFDTVMSGEKQGGSKRHYSVRPLDEQKNGLSVPRLLNVAFSRSKKELAVIADMDHVNRVYGEKFLGKLLEKIK